MSVDNVSMPLIIARLFSSSTVIHTNYLPKNKIRNNLKKNFMQPAMGNNPSPLQ